MIRLIGCLDLEGWVFILIIWKTYPCDRAVFSIRHANHILVLPIGKYILTSTCLVPLWTSIVTLGAARSHCVQEICSCPFTTNGISVNHISNDWKKCARRLTNRGVGRRAFAESSPYFRCGSPRQTETGILKAIPNIVNHFFGKFGGAFTLISRNLDQRECDKWLFFPVKPDFLRTFYLCLVPKMLQVNFSWDYPNRQCQAQYNHVAKAEHKLDCEA